MTINAPASVLCLQRGPETLAGSIGADMLLASCAPHLRYGVQTTAASSMRNADYGVIATLKKEKTLMSKPASKESAMKRIAVAALITAFTIGGALAQGSCESRALSKDGKPLAGAAKTSFLAKCKREACAPKAVGSDGKPLRGAAKRSFMGKCAKEA